MPHLTKDRHDTDRTRKVVNHIRALLEKGALQPGDRIPPERELARTLNISRASLRTGIGYLVAMGVMTVRHGVGTFIKDGPAEFSKASVGLMSALYGFHFWQMFEARLIIESSLAALAAERCKEEHHTALAEQVADMFACTDNPAEFLVHDMLFHRIIAQASRNPILAALIETFTTAMYEKRRKTVERTSNLREMAEMHREIYRAIRAHNPVEARKQMEQHLKSAESAQNLEVPGIRQRRTLQAGAAKPPALTDSVSAQ
jgi:GntR family transcriptional regulator, transcriptional repressor for pyruvate dehydrogenase complex